MKDAKITYMTQSESVLGFPGGLVVKNPLANAGDTGLIPGPGRSHMHKPVCYNYY